MWKCKKGQKSEQFSRRNSFSSSLTEYFRGPSEDCFKWRTVELWTLSLGHFLCPKICLCGSSVLLKLTNRDYWNLSSGHFPYSISLFSYDRWYTLTNYKVSKALFGDKKNPPKFFQQTLKNGPFLSHQWLVNHSLCVLPTILCSCLEWSKWCIKIFHKSLVLLACGFLDEFDFHDVSVFFFVSSNWLPFCITPISKCSHSISISMEKVSI